MPVRTPLQKVGTEYTVSNFENSDYLSIYDRRCPGKYEKRMRSLFHREEKTETCQVQKDARQSKLL